MKRKIILSIGIGFLLLNTMLVNAIYAQMFTNRHFTGNADGWTLVGVDYVYNDVSSVTSSCEGSIEQDTTNAAYSTFVTIQIKVRTFTQQGHPDCGNQSTGTLKFIVIYTDGSQDVVSRTIEEHNYTWKSIAKSDLITGSGKTIDKIKFYMDNLAATSTSYLIFFY